MEQNDIYHFHPIYHAQSSPIQQFRDQDFQNKPQMIPQQVKQPMQQPMVQQPMQQPMVQQPMQQPMVQQPMVQQPMVQQPMVQQPMVQQPMVQQPMVQQPMVQQPMVQQPMVQPRIVQQSFQQPFFYYDPVEYVQHTNVHVKKPTQNTRDIGNLIDNTIGDHLEEHLDDSEIKMLKSKINDLENELTNIIQKKVRKCCVSL